MENLWGIPESGLPDPLWLKRRPACRQSHPRISGAEIMFRLLKQGKNKLTFLLDRLSQIKEDENGHVCFFTWKKLHISLHPNCDGKPKTLGRSRLKWRPEVQFADWTCCDWHKSITSAHTDCQVWSICVFVSGFFHVKCSLSQWTLKKKVWTLFSLLNMESPKV